MTHPTPLPKGVFAAALTPLDRDLAPDHDAFVRHGKALLAGGCDGLAVLGSTGEANSLPLVQRRAVLEAAASGLPVDRLMMGTGACAVADAIEMTRASTQAGIFNVLVLPPFYYKPIGEDGVFAFFSQLIESVADQRLRVFLYNFPQLTGFTFTLPLIERLFGRHGAIIAGAKDSSGDWESMRSLCGCVPDFAVYAGTEKFLLDILDAGGAGCITATANLTAAACQSVFRSWNDGDRAAAQDNQSRLTEIRLAMQQFPLVPLQKALLHHRTGDDTWERMLPPFTRLDGLDDRARAALLQDLPD